MVGDVPGGGERVRTFISQTVAPAVPTWKKIFSCCCLRSSEEVKLTDALENIYTLPAGKRLIDALIEKQRYGFDIRFKKVSGSTATGVNDIAPDGTRIAVTIHINLDSINSVQCSRLSLINGHYTLQPMNYPPFITIAHELVHALHYIERWEQLQREFPNKVPSLTNQQTWSTLFFDVISTKPYSDIPGIGNLRQDGLDSSEYLRLTFRVLAINDFNKKFLFSTTDPNLDNDRAESTPFWNDNQEEESLCIMGDDRFNDCLLLEQAHKLDMLKGYKGFETNGSIFRWGHRFHDGNVGHFQSLPKGQFDNIVDVFSKTLPADLRRDPAPTIPSFYNIP